MTLIFCTLILFSSFGWSEENLAQPVSVSSKQKTAARTRLKKSYYQINMQYLIWEENINASAGAISGSIPFQFTGLKGGLSYNAPLPNVRWVQSYAGDLSLGTTKGGNSNSALTDEFQNQVWYALTFTPGLTYRTSAVSELSLILPLTYRKVNWSYEDTLYIELARASSFSVGLGVLFALRFTPKSALFSSITHQQMWQTTQWSIGWQYAFK